MGWTAGLGVLLVLWGAGTDRDPDPREEPFEISAEGGMVLDLAGGRGSAHGNVVIRSGDFVLCCDRLEAKYADGSIEELLCKGRVVIRKRDGTQVTASQVDFRASERRLTFQGNVVVWQKGGMLAGPRMIFDLRTERLEVTGARSRLSWSPGTSAPPPAGRPCPRPVLTP